MARPRYAGGSELELVIHRPLGARLLGPYLRARLGLPANWVSQLFASHAVTLDGVEVSAADRPLLAKGQVLAVRFPEAWPPHLAPTPMPLTILYEDDSLIALDKPAGVVVHPSRGHMDGGSLQNGVLHHLRDRIGKPGVTIGPAHRLDLETSGVILFAKTTESYRALTAQFATQHPHKEYLALVEGAPAWEMTSIRAPIGVDPEHPTRCAILGVHEGGKEAETDLYCLERGVLNGAGWALLRATPRTGRPHQVRIHCRHAGHIILGDKDYHPNPERHPIARHALHATAITLTHPTTGKRIRFETPLPPDFQSTLEALRRIVTTE